MKRISYIENHWPYFLGFGFLLSFLSTMSSTVVRFVAQVSQSKT